MNQATQTPPKVEAVEETKKCPDCLADIPKAAKKCLHCGKKQKQNLTKFQVGLVLTLLLVIFLPAFMGVGTSTPKSAEQISTVPTGSQAYITAQYYVTKVLKSPKTADFPSGQYNHNIVGGETHVVTGHVDSENSFGAMLRSTWTASMKFNGGNWADVNNWTLERLVLNGVEIYVNNNSEQEPE